MFVVRRYLFYGTNDPNLKGLANPRFSWQRVARAIIMLRFDDLALILGEVRL
jgi:hypothetical protein